MNDLARFMCLQVLDVLTTLEFLSRGVQEGNPVVRLALHLAPSPLEALVALKVLALGLAVYCWWAGRRRLLGRMNIFFAVVVAWNLLALAVQLVAAT